LAVWTLAITAVIAVRFAVFRASCALADAGEPGWGKSSVLVAGALAFSGAFMFLAGYFVPAPSEEAATGRFFAMAAAVVAAAVVAAAFYAWLLPTSLRRGAVVAGSELLLGALLASLVAGVVLVGLAVYQLQRRPEPQRIPGSVSAAFTCSARA
jgi:hypothetical protein